MARYWHDTWVVFTFLWSEDNLMIPKAWELLKVSDKEKKAPNASYKILASFLKYLSLVLKWPYRTRVLFPSREQLNNYGTQTSNMKCRYTTVRGEYGCALPPCHTRDCTAWIIMRMICSKTTAKVFEWGLATDSRKATGVARTRERSGRSRGTATKRVYRTGEVNEEGWCSITRRSMAAR